MSAHFMERLQELAGEAAAHELLRQFGGRQVLLPKAPVRRSRAPERMARAPLARLAHWRRRLLALQQRHLPRPLALRLQALLVLLRLELTGRMERYLDLLIQQEGAA